MESGRNKVPITPPAFDAEGAAMMTFKPIDAIHQHICAFHVYSHDRTRHIEAHHFCTHLSPDLHQCIIYDSDEPNAKLIGIEYIVPEKVFKSLSVDEKKYWHSHQYEVESGLLQLMFKGVVPGTAPNLEKTAMVEIQKTYGKTIHTWAIDSTPDLPLGPPYLMMSYTHLNPIDPEIMKKRDERTGISTEATGELRKSYLPRYELAEGVDQWEKTGKATVFEDMETEVLK